MNRTRATSVVINDGKLLMIHRFNNGEEYFVLPGGGVEDGEELERAATRELKEETSVNADLREKLLDFIDKHGDRHILFSQEYISGEPKLAEGSTESESFSNFQKYFPEWVDIKRLPELTIYPKEEKEFLIKHLN